MNMFIVLMFFLAFPVWAQPEAIHVGPSDIGEVLQTPEGMTLYTCRHDPEGRSVCNGGCAKKWIPFLADPEDMAFEDYSIVTRDDGLHQWAYKGKPLYTWVMDMEPGQTTGDGVGAAWSVARVIEK